MGIHTKKEWMKSVLQRPSLLPLPSTSLPHCSIVWCITTFPILLLLATPTRTLAPQSGAGEQLSLPGAVCSEMDPDPVKLTVVTGAWSQDVVNLFYSTLSSLNETPSYMTGHLHLGVDAKWFFNTNTAPWEVGMPIISEWAGVQKIKDNSEKLQF